MLLNLAIAEPQIESVAALGNRDAGDAGRSTTVIKRRPQLKGCPHAHAPSCRLRALRISAYVTYDRVLSCTTLSTPVLPEQVRLRM